MRQQQNKLKNIIAPLRKVSLFSKYFALSLFIILPFVGGYIGYQYNSFIEEDCYESHGKCMVVNKDIDFSQCAFQSTLSMWEGVTQILVLGDVRNDSTCLTLRVSVTEVGDGGYMIEECWIPRRLGVITSESTDDAYMEGKVGGPTIPDEYCTPISAEGVFHTILQDLKNRS
jgi:hypothetical protein